MAEGTEGLREVHASEMLAKIEKGEPVEYNHVRIVGDLDLSKLDLPIEDVARTEYQIIGLWLPEESKVVSSSIKITNSKFDAKVNFGNSLFRGQVRFKNTTFTGYADFNGATFTEYANFKGATFIGHAIFSGATFCVYDDFSGTTIFSGATFCEYVDFRMVTFSGEADFSEAAFVEYADFGMATFSGFADFDSAAFSEYAHFIKSTFRGEAYFVKSTFGGYTYFIKATFSGDARFDRATFSESAEFRGTTFNEKANFAGSQFKGDNLTFESAIFKDPKSQEEACRRAKNVLAKAGNRDEEEYHFYREMEAKRIQKGLRGSSGLDLGYLLFETDTWSSRKFFLHDVLEFFFVQGIFGYGVHPKRLMISWGAIVFAFGFFYWWGKGIIGTTEWLDYIKISFAIAIAPGYIAAIINPGSAGYRLIPAYQIVAMTETIVGTFLWAGFIATFAKKYMR